MKNKLYILMGKSATGKDTLYRELRKRHPGLAPVIPYTTRPIREGEVPGESYIFVTEAKMRDMEKTGRVIESRCYHTVKGDWYYFTADDEQLSDEIKAVDTTGRLSGNSLPKNRFPLLGGNSSTEGVDVGASATEDGKIPAKVGNDNSVSRVFGQSAGGFRRFFLHLSSFSAIYLTFFKLRLTIGTDFDKFIIKEMGFLPSKIL